jgi:hypothetical protein
MMRGKVGRKKQEASNEKLLNKIYYDPNHAASFGGINALKRVVGGKVSTSDIKSWLQTQDTYTLHKPIRRRFKRRRIIVSDIDEQWEADLVDLTKIAKFNGNFKYLLTVIDTLSKFAWVIPLRNKTGAEQIKAFTKIFSESNRKPVKLRTDKGGEFLGGKFQEFLKKENIESFTSNNEVKAAIVERFNKTLKTKMWKYFTKNNTLVYKPVLQKLVNSYNNTWHRSIKRQPNSVNETNAWKVWRTLYATEKTSMKDAKFRFKIGDKVRISKSKMVFEKGYLPNWTTEIFTIKKRIKSNPPLYIIEDYNGEIIKGSFYETELQKVVINPQKLYKIERILAERGKGKNKEYLVKWVGYPMQFNSYVCQSDIERL